MVANSYLSVQKHMFNMMLLLLQPEATLNSMQISFPKIMV